MMDLTTRPNREDTPEGGEDARPEPSSETPRSEPVPRTGSVLILSGLVAIGVAAILIGYYYTLPIGDLISNTTAVTILYSSSSLLAGIGVILVAVGWGVDQKAVRALTPPGPSYRPGARWVGRLVLIPLGAACIAGVEFYFVAISWAALKGVYLYVTEDTLGVLEYVIGLGVLLLAVGWFLHHADTLRRLESSPRR